MGKAVEITRRDLSASDLRGHASKTRDGQVVRRLLALAMVLDGVSREAAADRSGMDRQTLRDWVHRYNAEGIPGLTSRFGGGPPPALTEQQMADLKAIVLTARIQRSTVLYAGAALIFVASLNAAGRSGCTSEPWESCFISSA